MNLAPVLLSDNSFPTFGDLLKYLRRRARLTQLELSVAVGYSEAQISRLEKNQRLPDLAALRALFIPALQLENEPQMTARLLEKAQSARQEDAPAPGMAPYKGLLFFEESDCELFFGRETLTISLASRVMALDQDSATHFLAIVGASGSGKSSLVRAGLTVALRRAGWQTHIFTPTASPLKSLEINLLAEKRQEATRTVLLVDQLEEVFTLCHDESERLAFIEKLLARAQAESEKSIVIVALRADFYSHCAQYPLLRHAIANQQEYIGQMTTEELRRAIEEPARRGGWEFEPGLVDVLLQDVGAYSSHGPEPGALPLLSHALLATWERRRGHLITLDDYHATGGIRGAIAQTAEGVFTDQLDQAQQEIARNVFLRLTELGEGTVDTRRRASLHELTRQPAEAMPLRTVLNILAEARLVTLNEENVEVSHEALIGQWQRLREWLQQDREGLLLHRHLTAAAHEWKMRRRDPADLYRGGRLAQACEWVSVNDQRLNELEREFLGASLEQEQRASLEREVQRQHELETAQRLAEAHKRRAEEQTRSAHQMRRHSRYLTIALITALMLTFSTLSFSNLSDENALNASSARATAVGYADNSAKLINALFGEQLLPLPQGFTTTVSAVHSPSGLVVAVRSDSENIVVHDAKTGGQLFVLTGHTQPVTCMAFSADGTLLASGSLDETAIIWDLRTGRLLFTLRGHQGPIESVSFSPDGKRAITSADDSTAIVWDLSTGSPLLTLAVDSYAVLDATYSPDGTHIATANQNGTVKLWDARSGKELLTLKGNSGVVVHVRFSPDGKWLLGISNDGRAKVWNSSTGDLLYDFTRPDFRVDQPNDQN